MPNNPFDVFNIMLRSFQGKTFRLISFLFIPYDKRENKVSYQYAILCKKSYYCKLKKCFSDFNY